jgi:hypothetical protein
MPPRDILLKTNRPGSFGLAGAALRLAECRDIQPCLVLFSLANNAVTIPKQPWPFSAA